MLLYGDHFPFWQITWPELSGCKSPSLLQDPPGSIEELELGLGIGVGDGVGDGDGDDVGDGDGDDVGDGVGVGAF